eukprot:scaffold2165_cov289-Prasinococcus_capsulatus_cf.AAC.2
MQGKGDKSRPYREGRGTRASPRGVRRATCCPGPRQRSTDASAGARDLVSRGRRYKRGRQRARAAQSSVQDCDLTCPAGAARRWGQ